LSSIYAGITLSEIGDKEMTFEKILPIWWSFIWRATVAGVLIGFFLGLIGGFIAAATGHPELAATSGALFGYLGSIPASIWALKAALDKHNLVKS
jgi:ribose/xylose/arabinose/galactoside ABC-type transport system permease subunit